ncbi:MAG TPA: poly(A) polymerase [Clostridiales bacterium]|nr:poly(A) polymerase [Clostridiales bacterium]
MNPMPLPKDALYIMDTLAAGGHRADVVGGCVRDFLMGKTPHDYDMTTDATPEEMKAVFSCDRVIETGIRHGTLTVLLHGVPYEITTYRVDGGYTDHRHPDGVSFTRDLTEDLARRDFTVNAIAYHPAFGYTDPFGGMRDLRASVLRAVGDPCRRFEEDALRILRALRFSATLDFTIEEETAAALRQKAPLLSAVSVERVDAEWKKWIEGKAALRVLRAFADVLPHFFPEIADSPAIETLTDAVTPSVRTWYLFTPFADAPARYDAAMRRLHADNHRREGGIAVLTHLHDDLTTDADLLTLLAEIGEVYAADLLTLRAACHIGEPGEGTRLAALLANHTPYRISDLAVGGKDLAAIGYRGEKIGQILNTLILRVRRGELENEKDALLAAARLL